MGIDNTQQILKEALLKIRKLKAEKTRNDKVGIIGMACRFPGGVRTTEDFWKLLVDGKSGIQEMPEIRKKAFHFKEENIPHLKKAGYLQEDIEAFDAALFNISPKEAEKMDPQQRLFLKVCWEALENAGYAPDRLEGKKIGVYAGVVNQDYLKTINSERGKKEEYDPIEVTGNYFSFLSGRVSYFLGLQGPSISIDTACSSSLVAIAQAYKDILLDECDMAIAGGVNILYSPETTKLFAELHILSESCEVSTFDEAADGTVRGEGCGVIILKRLTEAERDNDSIHAVIRGEAVNQDGPSSSLTAPLGLAQEDLIKRAWKRSDVSGDQIGYIEVHGTGTKLGDPLEFEAISNIIPQKREKPLFLGSVKTNIGHLESAAGAAGIIKTVLMLQKGIIPCNLNYSNPSSYINWSNKSIKAASEKTIWNNESKRIAGVSSFGLSGTNAHIVLEEYQKECGVGIPDDGVRKIFKFSANSSKSINEQLKAWKIFLDKEYHYNFDELCFSQNISKADLAKRMVIWGNNTSSLLRSITNYLAGKKDPNVEEGKKQKKVVFLFTGQGSQYANMTKDLYVANAKYRYYVDCCNEIYKHITGENILDIIFSNNTKIDDTRYTQPALFIIEYAMAKMWEGYGVMPDFLIGHSVGEYVAAVLGNVFSLEDAMKLIVARGTLMSQKTASGMMAAVKCDRETAKRYLDGEQTVSIAVSNTQLQTVLSGDRECLSIICKKLSTDGIDYKILRVTKAFHSPLMNPILQEFQSVADGITYHSSDKVIISNLTGEKTTEKLSSGEYWRDHIKEEVRFYESIKNLSDEADYIYIEMGPAPILSTAVRQITNGTGECHPTYYAKKDCSEQITECLGALYLAGCHINWKKYYQEKQVKKVWTPNYSFDEKHYSFHNQSDQIDDKEENLIIRHTSGWNTIWEVSQYIKSILLDELKIAEEDLKAETNLLLLGLNSIIVSHIVAIVQKELDIKLKISDFLTTCTIESWAEKIWDSYKNAAATTVKPAELIKISSNEPFEFNQIQNAYWTGRSEGMDWGGVSCSAIYETIIHDLNVDDFSVAMQKLIKRHEMLRCVITEDGKQKILKDAGPPIEIHRKDEVVDYNNYFTSLYKKFNGYLTPINKLLFRVILTEMNDHMWKITFFIDFIISDALSVQIFWRDLNCFYNGRELERLGTSYREYVYNTGTDEDSEDYIQAKKYWEDKMENFPSPPNLPYINSNIFSLKDRFVRRKQIMPDDKWKQFCKYAALNGLTPSAALLALFSEVISAWGGGSAFAIMLTVFKRENIHDDIQYLIGDFTRLTLVEIHRQNISFVENAKHIQTQMQNDISHSEYSAIEFVRELRKMNSHKQLYPVVFTSALGIDDLDRAKVNHFTENMESISSTTPQVFLDHQIFKEKDGVALSWDSIDSIFFPEVIEDMFRMYTELVFHAAEDEKFWNTKLQDLRPVNQKEIHTSVNNTYKEFKECSLVDLFRNKLMSYTNKTAIIFEGVHYSYNALSKRANQISNMLLNRGIKSDDRIIVQMKRSFDQISAVLGILQIGAVYIPVVYNNPSERTNRIIKEAKAKGLVCDIVDVSLQIPNQFKVIEAESFTETFDPIILQPESIAYVIYTSGSTGNPKGVVIKHNSAMNTLLDVIQRYKVDASDRVLALSSLNFDLSVFDIFGMLSVGGTLILPTEEERIEPSEWYRLICEHNITIWNSVPSLMKLFLEYIERRNLPTKNVRLRQVILSGDWIPLDIFPRLKNAVKGIKLTSMGGATEASIWSNYYDVEELNASWQSIPYGYPLSNQEFYILDTFGRPCPNWVKGKLHISGAGLALGYLNNKLLTDKSFYKNAYIGKRLYNTGDFGRYRENGAIEFLGRGDGQVKINGFRVELGEIKAAFRKSGMKEEPILIVIGDKMEDKKIVAFLTANNKREEEYIPNLLKEYLPSYLIPESILFVDQIPVNSNGKVDNNKLREIYNQTKGVPKNVSYKKQSDSPIIRMLENLFNVSQLKESDSFQMLGISSIEMIKLANELELEYDQRPSVVELMSYKTIGELLEYYNEYKAIPTIPRHNRQEKFQYSILSEAQINKLDCLNDSFPHGRIVPLQIVNDIILQKDQMAVLLERKDIKLVDSIIGDLINECMKMNAIYKDDLPEMVLAVSLTDNILSSLAGGVYLMSPNERQLVLADNDTSNISDDFEIHLLTDLIKLRDKETFLNIRKWFLDAGKIYKHMCSRMENLPICIEVIEENAASKFPDQYYHVMSFGFQFDKSFFGIDAAAILEAERVLQLCNERKIELWTDKNNLKYKSPKGMMTADVIDKIKTNRFLMVNYLKKKDFFHKETEKFRLSPLQQAYVLGRNPAFELGNISAHYYIEFKMPNINIDLLNRAINSLIEEHEMLRTIIFKNGTQKVLNDVPCYSVTLTNRIESLENVRKTLSHQQFALEKWPMFHIQVTSAEDVFSILHLSFDCTIMDGWSTELFLRLLFAKYQGKETPKSGYTFREYIQDEEGWVNKNCTYNSHYWLDKIKSLPPAPALPMVCKLSEVDKPEFKRLSMEFPIEESRIFMENVKRHQFTPSAVVCTAYMRCLSHWAQQESLTLNVTLFGRLPLHKDVMNIIGDFTNIALIPYARSESESFLSETKQVQKMFWEAIENRMANGLEAFKELSKGSSGKAVLPVVFTSLFFGKEEKYIPDYAEEIYSISQTPQVSLDHQAFIRDGKMRLIWDYVDNLFDERKIKERFEQYCKSIHGLIQNEEWE